MLPQFNCRTSKRHFEEQTQASKLCKWKFYEYLLLCAVQFAWMIEIYYNESKVVYTLLCIFVTLLHITGTAASYYNWNGRKVVDEKKHMKMFLFTK